MMLSRFTLAPVTLALILAMQGTAWPQAFDMSKEKPAGSATEPTQQIDPAPVVIAPKVEPAVPQRVRYLVPFPKMVLDGELNRKTWTIYLTAGQAASAQKLNYGYRNAIFVAPETSKLSVYINDTLVGEQQPVQSPDGISERSFDLPRDLLKPGANKISFQASQQHRTDCTVESTYDLWSEIIPEKTYLALDPNGPAPSGTIEDVKAIGVDKNGRTHFKIVVPKAEQNHADAVMRLGQGLSLLARMPNQSVQVTSTIDATPGSGDMTIVAGSAMSLAELLPGLPESAKSAAFAGFVDDPVSGQPVMVLSGPNWQSVETAIENMVTPLDRPEDVQRDTLSTQASIGSDTPFITSRTSITLAKLGVETTEFSGRRFRTGFDIGIPADFYAGAYGEAQILLDAAYSSEILPGSHIDVYVNGSIASTLPITSSSGGILRHLPIRVTMRHFLPGANRIEIEAILKAKSDLACVPGTVASAEPRFALFNSSELRIPDFARIAELPNLSAISGTGFPYGRVRKPIALFLDRADDQTLSAAATLLGKMAVAAGRPVTVTAETSTARIGENDAIFVGAISQIPQAALDQTHIAQASRTAWGNTSANVAQAADGQETFDEWKSRVRGGSWQGQIAGFEDWMKQTFDISFGSLQFLPADEVETLPPNNATFLMAQGTSPEGSGTWTVLSSPDTSGLLDGMNQMADETNWRKLDGHMLMFDKVKKSIEVLPATNTRLVETQPFSLANYRLIAANWLSLNILSYAALFAGFSMLLGLATSVLLNVFGRRK